MKEIKCLTEQIRDEISDAKKYAKLASSFKESDRSLGDMYFSLASQELEHSNMLHAQAVRLINDWKAKGNTAPESMQIVWDWEHENLTEETARIKMLLQMYRG